MSLHVSHNRVPVVLFCWHGDLENDRGGGNTLAVDRLQYLLECGFEVHLLSRTPIDSAIALDCHRTWVFNENLYRAARRFLWRRLASSKTARSLFDLGLRQANRMQGVFVEEKERFLERFAFYQEQKKHGVVRSFCKRRNSMMLAGAEQLVAALQPDIVMASFAWNAVIFDAVPANVYKILDTHDIQSRRAKVARKAGGNLGDRDCTASEEAKELAKADLLIAIQPNEEDLLRSLCDDVTVVEAGHAPQVQLQPLSSSSGNTLLFVANLYDPNVLGLKRFLKEDWPALRSDGWSLRVIGDVCGAFASKVRGVEMLGRVDDLSPHYREATVVLNLALYGTGLPIKVVEAVAAGKIVLARGQSSECFGPEFPIVRFEHGQAAERVRHLLHDRAACQKLEAQACKYAKENLSRESVYRDLSGVLHKVGLMPNSGMSAAAPIKETSTVVEPDISQP